MKVHVYVKTTSTYDMLYRLHFLSPNFVHEKKVETLKLNNPILDASLFDLKDKQGTA